jgi:hypothetical protein
MYLHAAANGSRTYGRTGLKCQNGWHALCGMAPTLWSSIRHVDQHGTIARREALPLGFRFCASCRRVGMRYSQNSIEYTVHETRNRSNRCLGGRRAPPVNAPAGARGQRPDRDKGIGLFGP